MSWKRLTAMGLVGAALLALAAPATAAAQSGSTVVDHNVTFSEFFPDDICGPRASFVTFNARMQVFHFTETNGTFNAQFTEVMTYHVDFVDPALRDQDSRLVDSIHHSYTPGGIEVFNETFHDFPTGIKIWYRLRVMERDGQLVAEREVQKVVGCP
jgi:hypothetical protein